MGDTDDETGDEMTAPEPLMPSGSTYKPDRGARKSRGGRKSKFNAERAKFMLDALKSGCVHQITAIRAAGLSKTAVYDWLRAGEQGKSPELAEFAAKWKEAIAYGEASLVYEIRSAARGIDKVVFDRDGEVVRDKDGNPVKERQLGQWTAAAWMLERRFYKRWSRRDQMQLTGSDDKPVQFRLTLDKPNFAPTKIDPALKAGLDPADELVVEDAEDDDLSPEEDL